MARSFSNSTDYVKSAALPTTAGANITMAGWFYLTNNTGTQGGMYNGTGASDGYGVLTNYGGGVAGLLGGVAILSGGPSTLSTGQWYHICFSRAGLGTGWFLDLNGVRYNLVGTNNANTPTGNFWAGTDGSNNITKGSVGNVSLWNVQLTIPEIQALAAGARPRMIRSKSLLLNWHLDGLTSPEPDYSGNVNNGSLSGTAFSPDPPLMMFTPRWPLNTPVSAAPSTIFRKTASRIGTRTGARQTWAA